MEEISLVIMAAGIGSRFGGLKQTADVDGRGHRIIDYSVYDAVLAGFRRLIFIISRENKVIFQQIADTYKKKYNAKVELVFQDIEMLSSGFEVPKDRKKPWGTAHAVACLKGVVKSKFALINADDFYGRRAFSQIHDFLKSDTAVENNYVMVGYKLKNTLSKNGMVSRGLCIVNNGYLTEISEKTGILYDGERVICKEIQENIPLDPEATVSVNMWGFTPSIIEECEGQFFSFLKQNMMDNPLACEFYLPSVVSNMLKKKTASVRVLDCFDPWKGITYRNDREELNDFLSNLIEKGVYPEDF